MPARLRRTERRVAKAVNSDKTASRPNENPAGGLGKRQRQLPLTDEEEEELIEPASKKRGKNVNRLECHICGKEMSNAGNLRRHKFKIHGLKDD